MATLLRSFFLGLLDSTARAGFLGDAIEHLVLLLESFQFFIPFFSYFLYCFTVPALLTTDPPHSILDGLVGTHALAVLSNMRHILSLRHSCLIAKYAIALDPMVLVRIFLGSLVGSHDTSP